MAKILSKKPPCFTVTVEEMEKYGWTPEQQIKKNPKLKELR